MALTMFFVSFLFLLAVGMPIAFTFLVPGLLYMLLTDTPFILAAQSMWQQFLNFVLLAIPLFILAGELMNTSGITLRIFDFASSAFGHIRGGLGHVNVIASMIFSGISGSSAADAAGLGRVEIKAMVEKGYRPEFAAAITGVSSTIGPIIPPSIGLVLYGAVAEVGVDWLFMAGIVPGLVMGLILMLAVYLQVLTGREKCPQEKWPGWKHVVRSFWSASLAIASPVVIVGGIITGVFTPTEAGVIAVFITLALGFGYGELKLKNLIPAFMRATRSTATIMFILSTVSIFAWVLTVERVPDHIATAMFSLTDNTAILWILILITLLFLGLFETASANLLIVTPILVPIAPQLGIDPVHLGVVIVLALMVGQITPPVGITLYIVTEITNIPMASIFRAMIPYVFAMIIALLVVTYWPDMVLLVPRLLGYQG